MKQFSTEDLVAYLYAELPEATKAELEEAISRQWCLQEKLSVLQESVHQLQSGWQHPRPQAVEALLQYAATPQEATA